MAPVPQSEYDDRLARCRALMRKEQVDCLIVTDPITVYYYAGIKVPAWQRGRPIAFVLPLQEAPALICWSGPELFSRLYRQPFPSWVVDRRIYPEAPMTYDGPVDWGIIEVLRDRRVDAGRIAIELGDGLRLAMPLTDFFLIREELPKATFVDSSPIVWGCRTIKSDWEQSCSRKACEIGGRAWARCIAELKPGLTAREIQRRILQYYLEEGADLDSQPPTALGGTGPGGTLQKGDVLYLDGGCSYMGYLMDFTRRCVFGPPSGRQRAEHDGMWEILFRVIDYMKPGVSMREVFHYSQGLLAKTVWQNYSNHPAKRIGHGIGLENEPPSLSPFDRRVLAPGMILTPEPKIETIEGLLNPEEQIIITSSGSEVISKLPNWTLQVVQ